MNNVRTRIVVCCYRGRFGTDLSVGDVLNCVCFHVIADLSMVSMVKRNKGFCSPVSCFVMRFPL
jgi:hypothetical protein